MPPADFSEIDGKDVTVAVIDSGIRDHDDLNRLIGCVDVVGTKKTKNTDAEIGRAHV